MKKQFILLPAILLCLQLNGQLMRFGGGLTFSTGVRFNTIETGNPGAFGKAYIKLFENTYLLPSVSVYNRYYRSTVIHSFKNYMFQGDLDIQYEFFREGPIRLFGMVGGNATAILSKYESYIGERLFSDEQCLKPGINVGGGIEMYIDRKFDSVLSAKYLAGPWDQFVIQLGICYHFYDRKRIGW